MITKVAPQGLSFYKEAGTTADEERIVNWIVSGSIAILPTDFIWVFTIPPQRVEHRGDERRFRLLLIDLGTLGKQLSRPCSEVVDDVR